MQPPYSPLTPFENSATNTPYAAYKIHSCNSQILSSRFMVALFPMKLPPLATYTNHHEYI